MSVFLGNDFVDGIADEVEEHGILDKFFMSRTFSFLRSNDLIYGPAIRHYMMGETPPAFDLLYWNGDGTNLPGPYGDRVSALGFAKRINSPMAGLRSAERGCT
jgi:polyhydroxyalkanoate synthase